MPGFVSLVGAGPGDPGLLTLAGRDRLERADVVVYDRLIEPSLLDYSPEDAERVYAGKAASQKALSQDEINALLVERAKAGKRVVRLKGGDPFVFGRGGEEALALATAGVPFEVVAGVTSAVAAPAYAGIPVTHRGLASSFAVVTGHEDDEKPETMVDWRALATSVDTIVVLMGGAALASAAAALIDGGRDEKTPSVSIEWGTTTRQRSVAAPLGEIAASVREAGLGSPLLTVIGRVTELRNHLSWFESRPLFGKRILVTRTRLQASALSDLLRREGAVPVELPALQMVPVATDDQMAGVISRLEARRYDWCLFTSTNTVDFVFEYLERSGSDARIFAGCKLAALGAATAAALASHGLRADLTASEFTSAGLLEAMPIDIGGARVLLPRAEGGSEELYGGLKVRGANVEELVLYDSAVPAAPDAEVLQTIREGTIDAVTFASSSSVRNLRAMLGADFARLKETTIACIGPVTAKTAREAGLEVKIEPSTHTIPALVEALKAYYADTAG
ncbi:MAG TPA: uroporphyrinogen-III C-methyltransferase [Dehalococcoidia bacterium]|nr:uroporphyrinogen-III C-methyltransferase [Dehalococcoidia bacterium]